MKTLINQACWLKEIEKKTLNDAIKSTYFSSLSQEQQHKLLCILLSILHAETQHISAGKKLTAIIERVSEKLRIKKYICSTLGMWNFHICHAKRYGYSVKEFRNLLEIPQEATEIVMRHIVEDIGLRKMPELIFAEYNHNIMATSVAALQKALNALSAQKVREDGLIGPDTIKAIDSSAHFLPDFFSLDRLNEDMILQTLHHFKEMYGVFFEPCVPEVVFKKDLRFIGSILKDVRRLRRVVAFFERDIDVPAYVETSMWAFHYLAPGDQV